MYRPAIDFDRPDQELEIYSIDSDGAAYEGSCAVAYLQENPEIKEDVLIFPQEMGKHFENFSLEIDGKLYFFWSYCDPEITKFFNCVRAKDVEGCLRWTARTALSSSLQRSDDLLKQVVSMLYGFEYQWVAENVWSFDLIENTRTRF